MFERTEVELLISLLEDYPNSTFLGELVSILSLVSSNLFYIRNIYLLSRSDRI